MLEFICSIPNWIGWTLVAILGLVTLFMFTLVIKTIIQMVKDRMEDEEEESWD